jgi:RNA polymerase sigma-70 factor (ECF subfamily)
MAAEADSKSIICELYSRYSDDIYQFALFSLSHESDAKDVVQEVFLRAYLSWGTFRHECSPKTWLHRIARNYMYDQFRKRRIEQSYRSNTDLQQVLAGGNTEWIETVELIWRLPKKYRDVLVMRSIEKMSVRDVSRVLGITESNVRVVYYRAKKKLLDMLE